MRRLSLLILIFGLIACQKTVQPKNTLRINIGTDPKSLDARKGRDLTDSTLLRMLFEGLTRVSKSGNIELALAEDVQISGDGKTYTFKLRPSFWSNGDSLTSADFADSWKSTLAPSFPSDVAYQLYSIKNAQKIKEGSLEPALLGVHTPDPQTLVVELENPIPYFLEVISLPSFFPTHPRVVTGNQEWALLPETHVGNGPFKLDSWKHSDKIRVVKNEKYWQSSDIKIDSVDFFIFTSDTELRMFEEGKLDWAGSPLSTIPADAIKAFRKEKKLGIHPLCGTYFFRVNTSLQLNGKQNPLASVDFRKALAVCLDRNGIVEHVLQGGQTSAQELVPPDMGLSEKGYFPDANFQIARALLEKGLQKLGRDNLSPIRLSYTNSDRNNSIAQAVQKQWQEGLGIHVELEAIEAKVFFQRLSKGELQLAAGSWIADFNDPINFLEIFKYKDRGVNNTGWES